MVQVSESFDRVKDSVHIRKDVDRAIEILKEERFRPSGRGIDSEMFERTDTDGQKETVTVFRGYANGTMTFTGKGKDCEIVMAWDYVSKMRPTIFRQGVDRVKIFLGLGPR